MARRREYSHQESLHSMLLDCIAAGAYYWFRAEGWDENTVSAFNRMKYREIVGRFQALSLPLPTSEQMYAYAAEKWPAHKLHPAPKSEPRE
jgi:hypothetical protein